MGQIVYDECWENKCDGTEMRRSELNQLSTECCQGYQDFRHCVGSCADVWLNTVKNDDRVANALGGREEVMAVYDAFEKQCKSVEPTAAKDDSKQVKSAKSMRYRHPSILLGAFGFLLSWVFSSQQVQEPL